MGTIGAMLGRWGAQRVIWSGFVVTFSALLAWFAIANAVTGVTRVSNPSLALQLSPHDAIALSARADSMLEGGGRNGTTRQIVEMSQRSLASQPLNPRALRLLGYIADGQGKLAQAHSLIELAAQISRREIGAQLWLIEYSVRKNDVPATLAHYDVALRSSPQLGQLLYPILTQALTDDVVRRHFVPYVKNGTPWLPYFLSYAINQDASTPLIATIVSEAGGLPKEDIYRGLETQLVGRLAATEKYIEAKSFYVSLKGNYSSILTSTSFDKSVTDTRFVPLTWQLMDLASIEAAFEGDEDADRKLHIVAGTGARGVVARKLLFLRPGRYLLQDRRSRSRLSNGATSYWEIKCAGSSAEPTSILQQIITNSASLPVAVPANCPVQLLEFTVSGGDGQDGSEIVINSIVLSPLGTDPKRL